MNPAGDEQNKRAGDPSRREFLRIAAAAVGAAAVGTGLGQSAEPPVVNAAARAHDPEEQPGKAAPRESTPNESATGEVPAEAGGPPWWMTDSTPRSRAVEVRCPHVVRGTAIDNAGVLQMLTAGLRKLTGSPTTQQAWQRVLGGAKRIAIKFNQVGAAALRTNEPVGRALLTTLLEAGVSSESIALIEAPEGVRVGFRGWPTTGGWGPSIRLGDQDEEVANWVHEADAIINVPFLKTHVIAGLSGCMKNLSHAIIRHPARYHANGCSPAVAQVLAAPIVHRRLKLNVVNALRLVIRNGPEAREADIVTGGSLLLGFDPVTMDTVGLHTLNQERKRRNEAELPPVAYLAAAVERGLGRAEWSEIERLSVDVAG